MDLVRRYLNDQTGATAIEYAVLAALIGIGMLGGLHALGDGLDQHYDDVNSALEDS